MASQTAMHSHTGERPTRVRYWVIVFAVTLAIVTYIDRVCISQAAGPIRADMGFSEVQMGYVFGAFTLGYALFEIPGGVLGDWMGARKVLMRIVIWWSALTALTGFAWNYFSMIVVRFLFGAGEAGCFPNLTKAFTVWLPHEERVRAQGILWMSARWGGAFTPFLVYQVLQFFTWRQAFMIFGAIGVIWALIFYSWYKDKPRDNKSLNDAELKLLESSEHLAESHGNIPWGLFLRSKAVWLLCAQYCCLSYGWYFYITWLPTYLKQARGLDLAKGAVLAGLPLFMGGVGSLFCGLISARVTRSITGSVAKTRRLMAIIGFVGACSLLLISTRMSDPVLAVVVVGLASFCNDLVMPGSWGACMDVGGKYAGTLSGAMNMMGNLGGVVSPILIGYILTWTNRNWDVALYVSAGVYFAGTFCWLALDPVTPLEEQ